MIALEKMESGGFPHQADAIHRDRANHHGSRDGKGKTLAQGVPFTLRAGGTGGVQSILLASSGDYPPADASFIDGDGPEWPDWLFICRIIAVSELIIFDDNVSSLP